MEISVAQERAFRFAETMSLDQAEGRAWARRLEGFGAFAKVTGLLQRPRDDDFTLLYREHRLVPFWHIACVADYRYERRRTIPLAIDTRVVKRLTMDGRELDVRNGHTHVSLVEECEEAHEQEAIVDGLTGNRDAKLKEYFAFDRAEVPVARFGDLAASGVVVVPPTTRASTIVHDLLKRTIPSIEADRIYEDRLSVRNVDLYYRPVYGFQYRWVSRGKEAVIEIDGLTGDAHIGGQMFRQYFGQVLDPAFLFDVGLDTVGLLVPGGALAVKIARKGLQARAARPIKD